MNRETKCNATIHRSPVPVQLKFPVAAVFNTNGLFQKPKNENKMARIAGRQ